MRKTDVVNSISILTSLPKKDSKIVLDAVVESIKNVLIETNKVSLSGFGTFSIVDRKARVARNPITGKKINVPAKKVLKFKPSNKIKSNF